MTNAFKIARTLGFAAIAAVGLMAAEGSAQASDSVDTRGMTLIDARAISNVGPDGATVTKRTEIYKDAYGRTVTVTKTSQTYPAKTVHTGGYGKHASGWTPAPQVYPEYNPDWTPAPLAYPEHNPDWSPAPQAYPEYETKPKAAHGTKIYYAPAAKY